MTGGYGWQRRTMDGGDGDFQEEDVWAMMSFKTDEGSTAECRKTGSGNSVSSFTNPGSGRSPSASSGSRMIPMSSSSHTARHDSRQSAPVNIPDWSKIYQMKATRPDGTADTHCFGRDSGGSFSVMDAGRCNDGYLVAEGENDVEEEDGMVPPHQWLTKKLAGNQISSFSMFEGVGRTLKGRDLRRVRNAVLTQTGFL